METYEYQFRGIKTECALTSHYKIAKDNVYSIKTTFIYKKRYFWLSIQTREPLNKHLTFLG